ncbi:MAG: hypothetical protein OHK0052_13160 [Anaerolineales bacterium]
MTKTLIEILENAYAYAQTQPIEELSALLPPNCLQNLKIIIQNAEHHKAVLGVTLTSIAYKIFKPEQDIRKHQEQMEGGYSGRGFDTRYITPFLKQHFSHFAMAESAWLTRSLEQPHPYDLNYPGKIRNTNLKRVFFTNFRRTRKYTTHSECDAYCSDGIFARNCV